MTCNSRLKGMRICLGGCRIRRLCRITHARQRLGHGEQLFVSRPVDVFFLSLSRLYCSSTSMSSEPPRINTTSLTHSRSPGCNSSTEIGIVYCNCGRNLKYKRSPTTFQKDNYDFNSITDYIIERNSSRGTKAWST